MIVCLAPTSAGKSPKPAVNLFSRAEVWALLNTSVSGLTWIVLGSIATPSGWMNVVRCFIVLCTGLEESNVMVCVLSAA